MGLRRGGYLWKDRMSPPRRAARPGIPALARRLSRTVAAAALIALGPACAAPRSDGLGSAERPLEQKIDRALQALLRDGRAAGPARVIVRARADSLEQAKAALTSRGGRIDADHPFIQAFTATIDAEEIGGLAAHPLVESISIDASVAFDGDASQPGGAPAAPPRHGGTGAGVRIAVIDSGLELTRDLDARRLIGFYDFTRSGQAAVPFDDYGHGTHVAGLIAGDGSASDGRHVGTAPGASILALKVLGPDGAGHTSHVIDAIEFVVSNRRALDIDIINLSLGHPVFEPAATDPLVLAVEEAAKAGILVVTAAGNYGRHPATGVVGYGGITSPGNAPSALTVGALDTHRTIGLGDDTIPDYSSRGPTWYDALLKPDIVAPGQQLVAVAALGGRLYAEYPQAHVVDHIGEVAQYLRLSGTSMAAAVATGTAALMLEDTAESGARRNRRRTGASLSPNALKAIFGYTAIALSGYDTLTQGSGGINTSGAVGLARAIDPSARVGQVWIARPPPPRTTIDGFAWPWAQTVVWRDMLLSTPPIELRLAQWGQTVVWGSGGWGGKYLDTVVWGSGGWGGKYFDTVVWGSGTWGGKASDTVVWGSNVVWGTAVWWSSSVVWGSTVLGARNGDTVVWGSGDVTPSTVVWGSLAEATGIAEDMTFVTLAGAP